MNTVSFAHLKMKIYSFSLWHYFSCVTKYSTNVHTECNVLSLYKGTITIDERSVCAGYVQISVVTTHLFFFHWVL